MTRKSSFSFFTIVFRLFLVGFPSEKYNTEHNKVQWSKHTEKLCGKKNKQSQPLSQAGHK